MVQVPPRSLPFLPEPTRPGNPPLTDAVDPRMSKGPVNYPAGYLSELPYTGGGRIEAVVKEVRKAMADVKRSTESELMALRHAGLRSPPTEGEINHISDRVMRMIDTQLTIERERRGYS